MLARISLEAVLRLVWVYTVRIRCEKSSETNQRLLFIAQNLFPKGSKVCQPKEMPPSVFVKIIGYIAYEKLDFAIKEIVYDLLSIDANSASSSNSYSLNSEQTVMNSHGQLTTGTGGLLTSTGLNSVSHAYRTSRDNLILQPVRMEIGLRAFTLIADTLQQHKELGQSAQPPSMPPTFNIPAQDTLSVYLNNSNNSGNSNNLKNRSASFNRCCEHHQQVAAGGSVILTDSLARELGLNGYFENVRRAFQDIIKTLDFTIGKPFLLTRPDNLATGGNSDASSVISGSTAAVANNNDVIAQTAGVASSVSSNGVTVPNSAAVNQSNAISGQSGEGKVTAVLSSVSGGQTAGGGLIGPGDGSSISSGGQYTMILYNADNKPRLSLFRTCVALLPRLMPLFKESELVEILCRLTVHIDDELKSLAFNALRTLVVDYPLWRRYVFTGFTALILREISETHVKLIDSTLKMLLQLINAWKTTLSKETSVDTTVSAQSAQLLEDTCQVLFHLEGFALFNLCHAHVQRRRYALILLRECKFVGEATRCYSRVYARHAYALDVLDVAAVETMRRMHMQCFNAPVQVRPDLHYLIEQSSTWETSVNTANYNYNGENVSASGATGGVAAASVLTSQSQQQQQQGSMPGGNTSSSSSIPVFSQLNNSHAISTAANLLANPVQTTTSVLSNIIQNATGHHQGGGGGLLSLNKMRTNSLSTYYNNSANAASLNNNSSASASHQQQQVVHVHTVTQPTPPVSVSSSLGE
jgi:hypothetical protein